jgi:hypothetical protein
LVWLITIKSPTLIPEASPTVIEVDPWVAPPVMFPRLLQAAPAPRVKKVEGCVKVIEVLSGVAPPPFKVTPAGILNELVFVQV